MICPKCVILNPLKDRPACKSIATDKKSLFESLNPFQMKNVSGRKGMYYFFKGFSKILMSSLVSLKGDMTGYFSVKKQANYLGIMFM